MKKSILAILVFLLALPLAAETWKNVSLMDGGCAGKKDVMASPEKHTKSCAMQCAKAGYGAVVDGKFVKFDKHGSDLASEAIKHSDKKDNLRADISGEMKNGEIVVSKFEMNK
ncbi:MAG TPA: hypothetical protein VH087_14250 [Thermoanaerobaculia bacterium]|nr:hypothetical protein [Thermoanaerobaculia bacterium]